MNRHEFQLDQLHEKQGNCPHNRKRVTTHFERCLDCGQIWGLAFAMPPHLADDDHTDLMERLRATNDNIAQQDAVMQNLTSKILKP